jgi:hypothetical protein
MKRTEARTSVLRSIGYDADTAELEIEFTSADVYRYFAVPAHVYRELLAAQWGAPGVPSTPQRFEAPESIEESCPPK